MILVVKPLGGWVVFAFDFQYAKLRSECWLRNPVHVMIGPLPLVTHYRMSNKAEVSCQELSMRDNAWCRLKRPVQAECSSHGKIFKDLIVVRHRPLA